MPALTTLREWLSTLEANGLELVLSHMPFALRGARVRDLDELAERLEHPAALSEALITLPTPVLQVVEATMALGECATIEALTVLLDADIRDSADHAAEVERWVTVAADHALLWQDGDRIRANSGLPVLLPYPLGLARPAAQLAADLNSDSLARILRAWQVPAPPRKAERLAAVQACFADSAAIRRITGSASETELSRFTEHINRALQRSQPITALPADDDDLITEHLDDTGRFSMETYRAEQQMLSWALASGLAVRAGWGFDAIEIPAEVYLALRTHSFRVPFTPAPPAVLPVEVPDAQMSRTAAAAATEFLAAAMAVLESITRSGVTTLKSGGVGARELARCAKQAGTDVSTVRLVLTLAAEAGLLGGSAQPNLLAATDKLHAWRRRSPAERLHDLYQAWLPLDVAPTLERHDDAYLPVLGRLPETSGMPSGFVLSSILAGVDGQTVADVDDLLALVSWLHPMTTTVPGSLAATWTEATRLGVVADGRLTPAGDALSRGETDTVIAILESMLPDVSGQVMFGSDMTAVIPGSPDPHAVDVLDTLADREGHGVANTWRVTPESVRTALDAGYTADDLIESLQEIAAKELPQALDYLLRDVARRHGHLQARPAASVLISEDEALLAEVVASRALRSLKLAAVAPTVALSTAPVDKVLTALRAAGYLPVEQDDVGASVVTLRHLPRRSPESERAREHTPIGPDTLTPPRATIIGATASQASLHADPADLARALIDGTTDAGMSEFEESLATEARHLGAAETHELADAVLTGRPLHIQYQSSSGRVSARVISDLAVAGPYLRAFCHTKADERTFRLDHVLTVAPIH